MRHVGFETAPNQPFKVYASVLTEMFKRDPSLEASIVLEQRGDFFNSFFNYEIQLDTLSVRSLVGKKYSNRIYDQMRTVYGIPPELQYNKVLFVEKRGFNTMLNESGTLDRFNMGVVGTQGYAPRAAKKLMEYLINRGISVYILHDCDLFGYNIHERIAEGSDTYPMPLQVTDIGLKVDDVKNKLPERTLLNRDFSETLEQFTPDEARFFMPYSNVDGPPQDKI